MKYTHLKDSANKGYVSWPGFSIETATGSGASLLAEELNRLDTRVQDLVGQVNTRDKEIWAQVEAKNNALRKVADLEALGVEMELKLKGSPSNRALKQRLGVRTGQVRELLDVLERAQAVLTDYLDPAIGIKPRAALDHLLGILDDSNLVTRMQFLHEMANGVKNNGSVELTKADKLKVLEALDSMAGARTWPKEIQERYAAACRILEASEDGDVANGCQESDGFFERSLPQRLLDAGFDLKLELTPEGKQYIAGLGVGIEQPFIVHKGQTFIDTSKILDKLKSSIGQTELAAKLQERVVNNTINHFAPEPKASKKELEQLRKATEYFEQYADAHPNPLPENTRAAKHLRKLLKKLS